MRALQEMPMEEMDVKTVEVRTDIHRRIKELRERATVRPGDALAWQHLGFALHQSCEHEEAARAFERAASSMLRSGSRPFPMPCP